MCDLEAKINVVGNSYRGDGQFGEVIHLHPQVLLLVLWVQ